MPPPPTRRSFLVRCAAPALALAMITASPRARAGHGFEAGAGWGDMGDTPGALHWMPAIQGSRKDVPVYLGWRLLGQGRVYWAPSVRINYMNFWSIGGGGNILGATVAPAGLGVYLTRPPAGLTPAERRGRWFATFEASLGSLQGIHGHEAELVPGEVFARLGALRPGGPGPRPAPAGPGGERPAPPRGGTAAWAASRRR